MGVGCGGWFEGEGVRVRGRRRGGGVGGGGGVGMHPVPRGVTQNSQNTEDTHTLDREKETERE